MKYISDPGVEDPVTKVAGDENVTGEDTGQVAETEDIVGAGKSTVAEGKGDTESGKSADKDEKEGDEKGKDGDEGTKGQIEKGLDLADKGINPGDTKNSFGLREKTSKICSPVQKQPHCQGGPWVLRFRHCPPIVLPLNQTEISNFQCT